DRRARIDVLTDELGPIPRFSALSRIGTNQNADHVTLDRYQLVVVAGGGFACDYFGSHVTARSRVAARAEAAGVPVIVTGQGVGPLTEPDSMRAVGDLARLADAFSARDEFSQKAVERLDTKCVLAGDDALGLRPGRARRASRGEFVVHLRDAWYHTTDA